MVDVRWKSFAKEVDPNSEYLALVSYLPLKHIWKVPSFLRLSGAVQSQLRESSGLVGYSVRAYILKKKFFTLSVWENQKSLTDFVLKVPHHEVMQSLKPHMNETKFVKWKMIGSAIPPSWEDGVNRLNAE